MHSWRISSQGGAVRNGLGHALRCHVIMMVGGPNVNNDPGGCIVEILAPFAKHNISLTSIETRPALPEKWAYVFFIDLNGHVSDSNVAAALEEIRPLVKEARVLGSYPKAVL